MKSGEEQYMDLLRLVIHEGEVHHNRTGVDTLSYWCPPSLRFDLQDGLSFPVYTHRKIYWKSALGELFFFLSGSNKLEDLHKNGVKFWDANVHSEYWKTNPYYEEGSLGRTYSKQWREFRGYQDYHFIDDDTLFVEEETDQIQTLLDNLLSDPYSRRHVVTALHPGEYSQTALMPCHILFHVKCSDPNDISLCFTMRSNDLELGNPTNIIGYAALLLMLARHTGRKARWLVCEMHDAHIYTNHIEAIMTCFQRKLYSFPQMILPKKDFWDYTMDDFVLENYQHHPPVKMEMVV